MRFDHTTLSQRICFGTGEAVDLAARETGRLGGRVMLVAADADEAIARPFLDAVPVVSAFRDVVMHVPLSVAETARAQARRDSVDVILSVGGGSTTGTAKAIALTTGLPIVCVPTTYAGSEATNVWGLTDQSRKQTGVDERVLPRAVIYDAQLSLTLPVKLSIASGLNALAHCVDSIWGPRANPINRAFALEGVRTLNRALPQIKSDHDSINGREEMLLAAYLSATAFASAGSGLHHKLCHVLGGTCDLPHAETHAVVLPYVMAINASMGGQAISDLGAAFGAETADIGLKRLRAEVDAPTRLSDYGFGPGQVARVADEVMAVIPDANPWPVSRADIEALLDAARVGSDPLALAKDITQR